MKDFAREFAKAPLLNTEGLHRDLGTVMIVAPHPDDESLGCGGLIAHLKDQNAEVWILFMTNGEASHPNSSTFTASRLGDLRKKEAINACHILGVPEDHLIFLDAGDGNLASYIEENNYLSPRLTEIFQQKKIDTLFIPWRRDHHIDHVSTSSLVHKSASGMDLVIAEYPIWLWKKGVPGDWPEKDEILPFRLAIDSVKIKKKKAILEHKSQTTPLINDDLEGFVFTEDLLEPFLGDYEYFFFPLEAKPAVTNSYFEELFTESDDPWNFETSPYEQEKYENTLTAIPDIKYKNALEIGCANGVFTSLFAPNCEKLIALDVNVKALESAKKRCSHLPQCQFMQWDISQGIPKANFDIIILSEVGYYFTREKLQLIFRNIYDSIISGGILVMVHWTAYVRNYPLTGLQVHEIFTEMYSNKFDLLKSQRCELYELQVWKKLEK